MGMRHRPLVGERAGAGRGVLSQEEGDLDDHVFSPSIGRELQSLEDFDHTTLKVLIGMRSVAVYTSI
jgi:hypothetical protein